MAQITLQPRETQGSPAFPLGTDNTFADAQGVSPETIYVARGTQSFGATFNDGGDTIVISGSAQNFSISRSGNTVTLTNGLVTILFPVPDANLTAAQLPKFVFDQGTPGATGDDVTYTLATNAQANQVQFQNTAAGSQPVVVTTSTSGVTPGGPTPTNVTLTATATTVAEGGGNIVYTLTLSQPLATPTTVNVFTGPANGVGTADPGVDFTPFAGPVNFAAGQTTAVVVVQVLDDTVVEPNETVTLNITPPPASTGITVPVTQIVGTILASDQSSVGETPLAGQLTTGSDTFQGGAAADRVSGVQNLAQPGKLLSQNDILDGAGGTDLIELFNTQGLGGVFGGNTAQPNVLDDVDFTNVSNFERLETNYNQITLGAEALGAGINSLNTTSSDQRLTNGAGPNVAGGGTSLNLGTLLTLTPAFNPAVARAGNTTFNATLSSLSADQVSLSLAGMLGSAIDTGSNGSRTIVADGLTNYPGVGIAPAGTVITVAYNPIDLVNFTNVGATQYRVTLTSGAAGNGSTTNAGSAQLGLTVEQEDGAGNVTGTAANSVSFDDEGLRLTGAVFDVRGVDGASRGVHNEVVIGTQGNDGAVGGDLTANGGGSAYINGGGGDDRITGTGANDFLVGGTGNDRLDGRGGVDSILGGDGNDTIIGGAGIDALLDGGQGSDIYQFDNTTPGSEEFVAGEAISDSGTTAGDVDFIAISSVTPITDGLFAGRVGSGVEGLATNVTGAGNVPGGAAEVSVGTNAQQAGITQFVVGDDDFTAATYTVGITVYGTANITTGTAADIVALQSNGSTLPAGLAALGYPTSSAPNQTGPGTGYAATVNLGDGADTLYAGYSINNADAFQFNGGAGSVDRLVLGGVINGLGGTLPANTNLTGGATYTLNFGTKLTGFEAILIGATTAGSAVSYNLTLDDNNVAAGVQFEVDARALRGSATLANGTTVAGGEVLTFTANTAADRGVLVYGGGAADVLTGGAGVDDLRGGAGADQLRGRGGLDVLDGGENGDTYFYADTELVAGERVNDSGTTGTDTIDVTSSTQINDANFGVAGAQTKSGIEALTTDVAGGSNDGVFEVVLGPRASEIGLTTINNGNDDVSAAAFTTRGLTFNTGSGNPAGNTVAGNVTGTNQGDIVNIASNSTFATATPNFTLNDGNDQLNSGYVFSTQRSGITAGTVLSGGAGNADEIVIGGTTVPAGVGAGGTPATFNFNTAAANFNGFEKLTVQAAAIGTAAAPGNPLDVVVNLGAANDLALGADGYFTVDASTLGQAAGFAPATAGDQNFTLNTEAAETSAIKVLGGQRGDVITTGSGNDLLQGNAGDDFLNGGAGNDRLEGGAGIDTLRGGAGRDDLFGGDDNDTIIMTVDEFNNDSDSADGGAGTGDILQIEGPNPPNNPVNIADVGFGANASGTVQNRFINIEEVRLVGTAPGTAFNYQAGFYSESAGVRSISLGENASGSTVSVQNYLNNGATLSDIIAPSGAPGSTANNATFIGSNQADRFNLGVENTAQGGGNDTVQANGGADEIYFGSTLDTADSVDGGAGTDKLFVSGTTAAAGGAAQTRTVVLATVAAPGANANGFTGVRGVEELVLAAGSTTTGATTTVSYNVQINDSTYGTGQTNVTVNGSALRAGETLNVNAQTAAQDATTAGGAPVASNGGVTTANTVTVTGGAGSDFAAGGSGGDTLDGGAGTGNDRLFGNAGNDTLTGGAGDDYLDGGADNDQLSAGAGLDTLVGGLGVDTILLGAADGVRDTINVLSGVDGAGAVISQAPRAPLNQIFERVDGFEVGIDVIDFGSGVITENSPSIVNGVVQAGSILQAAINAAGSVLEAIQIVEQEFQSDAAVNNGVVAFNYTSGGATRTFIGEVTGAQGGEAFTDIVEMTGVVGSFTGLSTTAATAAATASPTDLTLIA